MCSLSKVNYLCLARVPRLFSPLSRIFTVKLKSFKHFNSNLAISRSIRKNNLPPPEGGRKYTLECACQAPLKRLISVCAGIHTQTRVYSCTNHYGHNSFPFFIHLHATPSSTQPPTLILEYFTQNSTLLPRTLHKCARSQRLACSTCLYYHIPLPSLIFCKSSHSRGLPAEPPPPPTQGSPF